MTFFLVYSTVALHWNRKIQCGIFCRRISLPLCLVWERRSHTSFSAIHSCLPATIFGQTFSSARTRCFLSTSILLSLIIFFNLLYSISKIALPRYSRVSYKKIEWVRIWSLIHYKLHVSRCDVERYCLIIFNTLVMQLIPSRAKCQHNYCFRVFWYVCLYAYPKQSWGEGKVVLVFEIIDPFFDLQDILYGQTTSTINSILF